MKTYKGKPGYIKRRKRETITKTVAEFGIVLALLILGYMQTKTKMNLLTVIAILGCLPASKALVEVIMIMPHQSIDQNKANEIIEKSQALTTVFDTVFTSEKQVMPVDALVISGMTVCGYSSSEKLDLAFTVKHLKQLLNQNGMEKVSVKIFDNYTSFITRVEGMNNIAVVDKLDTKKMEKRIRKLFLNISL